MLLMLLFWTDKGFQICSVQNYLPMNYIYDYCFIRKIQIELIDIQLRANTVCPREKETKIQVKILDMIEQID